MGGASASALAAQTAADDAKKKPRVLITSAGHGLARSLAANLRGQYQIRLTERARVETDVEFVECALEQDAATRSLVRGMDAIVHVGEPLAGDQDKQRIDYLTRCTYNLLTAAAQENVPRVVFLSTLELMTPYDASFTVSEHWRSRPATGTGVLSKHLGEYVCREFARDRKTRAVVLRLGKVVREGEAKGFDPLWVEERDVARAVAGALDAILKNTGSGVTDWWRIYHIGADSPRARFSIAAAKRGIGYQPQYQW